MKMQQMTELAEALINAEANAKTKEAELKEANKKAQILREETIPAAMQGFGMTAFTLESGQTISYKQDVYASIPGENKTKAFGWLEEHGFGGLIKSEVAVQFGRGELEEAGLLRDRLKVDGLESTFTEKVHGSTLKAFLNEQIKVGSDIPLDLFGARTVNRASVK